ncbi:retrotransposon ORF1 [Tanacetum coccineum]
MLIYIKAPLFLWAEALPHVIPKTDPLYDVAIEKTPYELLHDRKPDLSYLHVFEALCYPNNDSEDFGKLQAKADIGIFIGNAPNKKAYRIYNRHTQKIIETIHVDFDELTTMAFEQLGSGPRLQSMTHATSSSGLVPNPIPQKPFAQHQDVDLSFNLKEERINLRIHLHLFKNRFPVRIFELMQPTRYDDLSKWLSNGCSYMASSKKRSTFLNQKDLWIRTTHRMCISSKRPCAVDPMLFTWKAGHDLLLMDTEEVSDRFVAPCFVNRMEAYDGEINLGVKGNMNSKEYAVKLCLEHEVKRGNKVVKKELVVALRGEIYFVKFIINPEEDDVEPGVIFRRSFLCMTKANIDFGARTITIYPDIDPFLEETKEEEKINDDWDDLIDFNLDDILVLGEEDILPFVCKMGKSSRNKKQAMENLNFFYQDIGTSSSVGGHLTQEEAAKEALAIRMSRKFDLLEEERPIIEIMAYRDKYKKILDEVWKDKVELDGKIVKEEEEAVKRIEDTGLDINIMPYQIYEQLGRKDMKKVDRGITMINHTQAEAMGLLTNVLCQVGVTTLIAKFLILDIPIDRDAPIVVGRGFLCTIGGIVNTPERLFSTFDGFCHQTFRAARSDVMRNAESDSDDEEEYQIQRNKFGAPIYKLKPALYLNCNDPAKRSLWEHTMMRLDHHDPNTLDNMKPWKKYCFHKFTMSSCYGKDVTEMQILELCHEFYSTYEFDKVCADDELQTKKIIKFRLGGRAHSLTLLEFARRLGLYQAVELEEEGFNVYFEGVLRSDEHFNAQDYWTTGYDKVQKNDLWLLRAGTLKESQILYGQFISKIARKCRVLTEDVVRSLSAPIYCRDLDTTTLRDLIDSKGKLIPEDPQPGVPGVGIPRPPRASVHDLYQGVFEHMVGVYSVPLQGTYNPPGYSQPQYDQYYQ